MSRGPFFFFFFFGFGFCFSKPLKVVFKGVMLPSKTLIAEKLEFTTLQPSNIIGSGLDIFILHLDNLNQSNF